MATLLIAVGTFVAYLVAYHTYGRWLGRRIFQLSADAIVPSVEINDGRDYVPTPKEVVFGHHFTSIAGTGPIVGPAIAVFWGWVPALVWVLLGSIFIGAVHDFGALVVSMRSRGQTVGEVAGRMINRRARLLFLAILFMALTVVIGIFGLVIAVIFAVYPVSVFPLWCEIPMAVAVGFWVYKRNGSLLVPSLIVLGLMYVTIWIGAYYLPIDLTAWGIAPHGAAAAAAGQSPYLNAIVIWTVVLLVYCFFASVLPVWTLLQPRDFINSHELTLALGLLFLGLLAASISGGGIEFVAPAVNASPPPDAPPIIPFLFITIACGAVSGFHCLVSSGTSSKQIRREPDAKLIGYGAMLLEGGLAVVVILACTAGLGKGVYDYDPALGRYVAAVHDGAAVTGVEAWNKYYGAGSWAKMRLPEMIGGFIEGGANMLAALRIPVTLGIGIMAVLVASFAATTLDTATRLQRYVVTELADAVGARPLTHPWAATVVAVLTGGGIAMIAGPNGPGSGGLILWPVFGATNQLLAGLSFLVIAFYLLRHGRPVWFLIAPMALMIVLPAWVLIVQLFGDGGWLASRQWPLVGIGGATLLLQFWMVVEGGLMWQRARGVAPPPLPPLIRSCAACGHSLRNPKSAVCPECGSAALTRELLPTAGAASR
ncbi:MAG: carbon starvation protein A [Phycisphaerales bacterium]|nr:MAG: carbon starvation protein A [Phycisphaerales bacterium]